MDFAEIMNMLKQKIFDSQTVNFYIFRAEKSKSTCQKCQQYDGKIYAANDLCIPQLPLHPHCKCQLLPYEIPQNISKGKFSNILKNVPEATKTALEMKYLPAAAGEMTGAAQIAGVIAADYSIWAARTGKVIERSSKFSDDQKLDLWENLRKALAKKDIRTIIRIYNMCL